MNACAITPKCLVCGLLRPQSNWATLEEEMELALIKIKPMAGEEACSAVVPVDDACHQLHSLSFEIEENKHAHAPVLMQDDVTSRTGNMEIDWQNCPISSDGRSFFQVRELVSQLDQV